MDAEPDGERGILLELTQWSATNVPIAGALTLDAHEIAVQETHRAFRNCSVFDCPAPNTITRASSL